MVQKFIRYASVLLLLFVFSCSKPMTVISDQYLIQDPQVKKFKYVKSGNVRRGEFVKSMKELVTNNTKYYYVQIEGVDTKGWIPESGVKEGKLETVVVLQNAKLYQRPSLDSIEVATVKPGLHAFQLLVKEKEGFTLIQYPWNKEGYIETRNLGKTSSSIVMNISISGLGTATVSASSQLISGAGKELEFDPRNMFDGKLQTAWAEGKINDDGIDEFFTVQFNQYVHLKKISFVNGYTKSEELYKMKNRVAQMKIVTEGGQEALLDYDDNVQDYQIKDLDLQGNTFKFIIKKVFNGTVQDTCISEVKLEGEPSTQPNYNENSGNSGNSGYSENSENNEN